MMKIGIVGQGPVGQSLVQLLSRELVADIVIYGSNSREILDQVGDVPVRVVTSFPDFLGEKPEVVVECAEHRLAPHKLAKILDSGSELIVTSIATLADAKLSRQFQKACYRGQASWVVPVEAQAGVDLLEKLSAHPGLTVSYTLKRPLKDWGGAGPSRDMRDTAPEHCEIVIEGGAREVALTFPQSSNVLSALALAGPGFDRTSARFLADNSSDLDIHNYQVYSPICRIEFEIESPAAMASNACNISTAHKIIHLVRTQSAARQRLRRP